MCMVTFNSVFRTFTHCIYFVEMSNNKQKKKQTNNLHELKIPPQSHNSTTYIVLMRSIIEYGFIV